MIKPPPHVIGIGYAKRALEIGSREQERMLAYARQLPSYHLIVFTRKVDRYAEPITIENLTVYPTNARSKLGMLVAAYRIGLAILKSAPSNIRWIVTSQDPFETSFIGRLLSKRSKNIKHHVQIHADVFGSSNWKKGSLRQRLQYFYAKYVVRHAGCIRVVSERIARSLQQLGVPSEKVVILPIQLSLKPFLEVGKNRQLKTEDTCHFIYVGRLSQEKNLPMLLQAFKKIVSNQPGVTLELLGSGPEESRIKKIIQEYGLEKLVTMTSWTNDVPAKLATADVLVLTSDHEGWGMVLIEAMAAGLPVITTDVGCAREVARDNEHGLVVPVRDSDAFAKAMLTLNQDKEKRHRFARAAHFTAATLDVSEEAYVTKWVNALTCNE